MKLIGYAVLSSFFLATVGGIAFYSLRAVVAPFEMVAEHNLPKAEAISKLYLAQKDAVVTVSRLVGGRWTLAEAEAALKSLHASKNRVHEAQKIYESRYRNAEENELYQAAEKTLEPFFSVAQKMIELSGTGIESNDIARDKMVKTEFAVVRENLRERFDALLDIQQQRTAARIKEAQGILKSSASSLVITIVIGVILSILLGYAIARALTRTLESLASRLSGGADEVASASTQLSGTSSELSAASSQQAASLQETSASVQEISSMVARSSDNAQSCLTGARHSQDIARRGQEAMEQMIGAIDEINQSNAQIMEQVNESNLQITGIVQLIREIGDKTKVINDIVFQTKLLSFNASVEAARAGEHGKGFAVVAEEVGTLAQMSGNASKEIATLLENSVKKVDEIVTSSKSGVDRLITVGRSKVAVGTEIASRCSEILKQIVDSSETITQSVSEIATASVEQTKGTEEISRAMAQLDQVTQQNSEASHQAADAATQLSNQADVLKRSVASLLSLIHGGNASTQEETVSKSAPPRSTSSGSKPSLQDQDRFPSEFDARFEERTFEIGKAG